MYNSLKSFITHDGGLEVCLGADEVTWFDFLWYSRRINSLAGGWNSTTHWWKKGVLMLADDAGTFIKHWTENSLKKNGPFLPPPRTCEFRFGRQDSKKRSGLGQSLKEKQESGDILFEEASENELNNALFKGGLKNPLAGQRKAFKRIRTDGSRPQ